MTTTATKIRKSRLKQIDPITDPDRYRELKNIIIKDDILPDDLENLYPHLSDDLDIKHKSIDGIINNSSFLSNLDKQEYSPRLTIWEYLQKIDDAIKKIDNELEELWKCPNKSEKFGGIPTKLMYTELAYIDPAIQTPQMKICLENGYRIPFSDYYYKMVHLFDDEVRSYMDELDNLYAITPRQHDFLNRFYNNKENVLFYKSQFISEKERRAIKFNRSFLSETLLDLVRRHPGSTYTKLSRIATKEKLTDLYATDQTLCGRDHMKTLLNRLEQSGCIDIKHGKGNRKYYFCADREQTA